MFSSIITNVRGFLRMTKYKYLKFLEFSENITSK